MAYLFTILFLIALIATITCLIKPNFTAIKSRQALTRKQIAGYGFGFTLFCFVMVGIFAPPVEKSADKVVADKKDPAVAPKAEKTVEVKTDSVPVKVEANLGMTAETFRKEFNAQLKTLKIDSIRPLGEFEIETGKVRDSFQVMFSDDVGMTGILNKDGLLREITFIVGGTNNYERATMDLLIVSGVTAKVISPKDDVGKELVKLITAALKNIDQENNSHKKVFGNVEYYALANQATGLWVGVGPVEK